MLKNNKGVTITALVVTIIVILILAGTTITSSDMIITSTKSKTVITDMLLVSRKAEALYEEYQFNGTPQSGYAGTKNTDITAYLKGTYVPPANSLWYDWDATTLEILGFDKNMVQSGAKFIVNYVDGEVIYTKGAKDKNGVVKYTLTDLQNRR